MSPILGIFASSRRFTATDYESIATFNGTGSSGTITFSSIPSTYTHLQLRLIGRGTSGSGGYPTDISSFVINGDSTATNYYIHALIGNGTAASATAVNNNFNAFLPIPGSSGNANMYAVGIIDILDYKDTNKYKTMRNLNGADFNGAGRIIFTSMLWKNTSAINSISITLDTTFGGNWTTASQIALYGIK